MRRALVVLVLCLLSIPAFSQNPIVNNAPDCVLQFSFATSTTPPTPGNSLAPGTTGAFDNRPTLSTGGCVTWTLVYQNTGLSALSIEFDSAPDINGAPGTFSTWTSLFSGSLPLTVTTFSQISGYSFAPWLQVKVNSVTGTGQITGALVGYRAQGSNSSSGQTPISLPGITYNAVPTILTNGQTATDVDITNNQAVDIAVDATSDPKVALSSVQFTGLGATVTAVDANPGNWYGFNIGQAGSTPCYLQAFNLAPGSVTLGTTPPVTPSPFTIPGNTGGAGNSIISAIPIMNFTTALSVALTTTPTGATPCGSLGVGSAFFK